MHKTKKQKNSTLILFAFPQLGGLTYRVGCSIGNGLASTSILEYVFVVFWLDIAWLVILRSFYLKENRVMTGTHLFMYKYYFRMSTSCRFNSFRK